MGESELSGVRRELRDQGRAVVGALLVLGVTVAYTMETWWLGWRLPLWHLVGYDAVGLAVVLAITRAVSFRQEEGTRDDSRRTRLQRTLADFAELVFQSFVTAYFVLLLFGVIRFDDPIRIAARIGLIEVVPLAFGAALANDLLSGDKEPSARSFWNDLGTFALGAVFLSATMAPTEEMEMIAAYTDWNRITALVPLTLFVAYLVLYELDFQGQDHRLEGKTAAMQFGQSCLVYAVGLTVAAGLLAAFGHFADAPFPVRVRMTVVLALPASIGASAARVII